VVERFQLLRPGPASSPPRRRGPPPRLPGFRQVIPFWLVHAYMDALWSQWQQKRPASATDYNGTNQNGIIAQSSDQLPGFLATVRDTFSTNSFCYRYEPLGGSPLGSTSGG
jgi:hypothetical protein